MPGTLVARALEEASLASDLGFAVAGDYGDPAGEYAALRTDAAVVDRSTRGVVTVTGSDARSFLDALVSQALEDVGDGEGTHSLLLQPTGKLEVDFRLLGVGDGFWLDCEPGFGERLTASLSRYRIRVDAEITDRSGEWGVVSVVGPSAPERVAAVLGVTVPERAGAHVAWRDLRLVRDGRFAVPVADLVGPAEGLAVAWDTFVDAGLPRAGLVAWEALRIEDGVPRQGWDLDESTIPQEAFLEESAVSFDKGCFLGQELVCRIRDRGHVNRHLRRLVSDPGDAPVIGAPVIGATVIGAEGREVGRVTSGAVVPGTDRAVALAYVRREVEPGGTVAVQWDGSDVAATVHTLRG